MTEVTICGGNPQSRSGSYGPVLSSMLSFGSREDLLSSGSRACVLGMHLGCPHWTWPLHRDWPVAWWALARLWGAGGLEWSLGSTERGHPEILYLGRSLTPEEEKKEELRGYSLEVEWIRRASLENPPYCQGEEVLSWAEKMVGQCFPLFLHWKMEGL